MTALSIRQPWAWLIIHGGKDIENRDWHTLYRGELAIHAAKGMTRQGWGDAVCFVEGFNPALASLIPTVEELERGMIIGTVRLRGCVLQHPSPWFQGKYGWMLDKPKTLRPTPATGSLGLWTWEPYRNDATDPK